MVYINRQKEAIGIHLGGNGKLGIFIEHPTDQADN